MGRLGRLIGHGEEPPKPEASCGCPGVQKPPNSEEIDAGTGRLDRRQGLLLGQEIPRGQRQDFRRLIFCPALLRIEPHRPHRMRPHTWSLHSPFRRLTKTKELIPMDFPPEMGIAGIYPPPPPQSPPPLGKQACSNLLILWRKHGGPGCCQQRSLDNASIAQ